MTDTAVADHYSSDGILDRLFTAATAAGIDISNQPNALAGADEFHLGGAVATTELINDLNLHSGATVVDVGCGIGGAARAMAKSGADVLGVDLTPAFIDTAIELSSRLGMAGNPRFSVGNGAVLPVDANSVDAVTVLHVGMNISDKRRLFESIATALRPGGVLAVYDIMCVGDGDLQYPMPWATDHSTSFVESPESYIEALTAAGFTSVTRSDRLPMVLNALEGAASSPPPLTLGHLMGPRFGEMISNLQESLSTGALAPIQLLATKAAVLNQTGAST